MKVYFYDCNNDREVTGDQLCLINAVEIQPDGSEKPIGTLGYKSDKCPSNLNWDRYLLHEQLEFLRVE